jgi:predicted Zn-dependent protease
LEGLLSEFGRRRTPERANVHFQLALIERAEGNLEAALEQLDAASKIQRTDPLILKTLGDVAQQNSEFERAETAYRALLLLVGRKQAQGSEVGESAILFELYRIATQREDSARAKDLLDSALQAADQDTAEAERLEEALRQAGHWDLLLSALDRRLQRADNPAARDAASRSKAQALLELGRPEDALDILLALLDSSPVDPSLLQQAEELAARSEQLPRFHQTCLSLAERLETQGDLAGACALWMRLGSQAREEGNLPKAATFFERAQRTGVTPQETFEALRGALEVMGDVHGLTLALERYVTSDPTELDGEVLTEALFRLAEHNLCMGVDRERGLDQLRDALARDSDHRRAADILQTAADLKTPTSGMVQLADELAQKLGDRSLLLKAALWGADYVPLERLGEAIELASELGEAAQKPFLLEKMALRARAEHDTDKLLTALTSLAEIRRAGDANDAARSLLFEALQLTSGDEHLYLALQIAELDEHSLGQPQRAAEVLEALQAQHKGDVRVWKPLLALYRQLGEQSKLLATLAEAEAHADGPQERRALRLERIRLTMDSGRGREAERALRDALDDEPDNDEAAHLLVGILEHEERSEELRSLLQQLLDYAIERRAEGPIQTYALKLGALLERSGDNEAALQTYRAAHDTVRNNRGVLLALLRHVPETDESERANLLESLLPTEPVEGVENMSLTLASLRQRQDDEAGVERAYELGFKRQPQSQTLREKLLAWYREHEQYSPLAELLAAGALQEPDPARMVALLQEAASIYDTNLGDAAMAADVLVKGLERDPMALSLLEPACEYLITAGRPEEAMTLLDSTLADERHSDESLALVYHLRAAVRARTDEHNLEAIIDAISDLETAGTIGGTDLVEDLATLLLRQQQLAELQGQEKYEEEAVLRLSQLLPGLGQIQESINLLQSFSSRYPHNTTVKSKLAVLAFDEGNWPAATTAYAELVPMLEGDEQVATVLKLTEAATRSGDALLAKDALEATYRKNPGHEAIALALRNMYKAAGAHVELAKMLLHQASAAESNEVRFLLLRDAGEILVASNTPHPESVPTLEQANALSPGDHRTIVALARAHTLDNNVATACIVLEEAIKTHGKKRSIELAELQYAMSQVAHAAGDPEGQIAWLDAALQTDRRNGVVASELAVLSMERNDLDMATKALQLVTLLKDEGPMSRAEAYLRQAIIADQKGDPRKAVLLAKRALNADPNYEPARVFVEEHS